MLSVVVVGIRRDDEFEGFCAVGEVVGMCLLCDQTIIMSFEGPSY